MSLASLLIAQYVFRFLVPTDPGFLAWVAVLGFVSGVYFGWLAVAADDLLAPIIAHAVYDFAALAYLTRRRPVGP